jgi:hypothetical protein
MNKTKLLSTMGVGIAGPLLFAIVFGLLTWSGAHNLKGYGLATTRERWVYLMLPPQARFSFCWASMVTLAGASSCLGVWWYWSRIWMGLFSALTAIALGWMTTIAQEDLQGANLSEADLLGALYDAFTLWPEGFDPLEIGAEKR